MRSIVVTAAISALLLASPTFACRRGLLYCHKSLSAGDQYWAGFEAKKDSEKGYAERGIKPPSHRSEGTTWFPEKYMYECIDDGNDHGTTRHSTVKIAHPCDGSCVKHFGRSDECKKVENVAEWRIREIGPPEQ